MLNNVRDVIQRLTGKFQDVRRRANKNQQQLRQLVFCHPVSQGEEPLPQDEEDEQDLMESQDPIIWTEGLVNILEEKKRRADMDLNLGTFL